MKEYEEYDRLDQYYKGLCQHISSLVDTIMTGTDSEWDTSEPFCIGGPQGQYTAKSPFIGQCEWKCDVASAGTTQAQIILSSVAHTTNIDYTGASQGYTENGYFDGLVVNCAPNTTVPVDSEWYNLRNSENTLYVSVFVATNSAFANVLFRQKRGGK